MSDEPCLANDDPGMPASVMLRARKAAEYGCDGIIASADDGPDRIRLLAGTTPDAHRHSRRTPERKPE